MLVVWVGIAELLDGSKGRWFRRLSRTLQNKALTSKPTVANQNNEDWSMVVERVGMMLRDRRNFVNLEQDNSEI
jgi:hypothetical protein